MTAITTASGRKWVLTVAGLLMMATVSAVLVYRRGQEPHQASLRMPLPIDQGAEALLWGAERFRDRTNRYLPSFQRAPVTEQEQHRRVTRFVNFARARKSVYQGTATRDVALTFYDDVVNDMQQRLEILENLRPQRSDYSTFDHTALVREAARLDEVARLRAAILEYNSTARRIRNASEMKPRRRTKTQKRERVLCVVDATAFVYCALENRLIEEYVAGYWTNQDVWKTLYFNEVRGYDVLKRLDDIYRDRGLDPTKNTLVGCPSGQWFVANTTGPKIGSPVGVSPKELPSLAEMQQISKTCHSFSGASGTQATGPGGVSLDGRSQVATQTIERIDLQVNSCREASDSRIAFAPVGAGVLLLLEAYGVEIGLTTLLGVLMNTNHEGPNFSEEERLAAEEDLERMNEHNENAINDLENAAARLETEADRLEREADEEANEEKKLEAAKKRVQAEVLRREAECRRVAGMSCAELEAAKAKKEADDQQQPQQEEDHEAPQDASRPDDASNQLDGVNYSSCAESKSAWERFKAECNRTGSWDRPGSECNELVRRENGCVSTSVINPNPEADNTCLRISISEAEAYKAGCEERKRVMSVAEWLDANCEFIDRDAYSTSFADPCNDPAARPLADQPCSPPVASAPSGNPPPGRNPAPRPYGDVFVGLGTVIFDVLRFEGLGYRPNNVPGIWVR